MATKLITAPAVEPVSLVEAKAHLRVDGDDDNVLLTMLITTARQEAEKVTRRALITQTWEVVLDCFPSGGIDLPFPTLQSVTSIKYFDGSNVEQTLSTSAYQVDADSEPGRVALASGYSWPDTYDRLNAVRIRYVAGYGLAAAVPAAIKQWILIRVATLYENREGVNIGNNVNAIPFVDGLLDEYRAVSF